METISSEAPHKQAPAGVRQASKRSSQMSDKRREKKRIADRICQREARARNKNKIAELESLVTHLTSLSGNEVYGELKQQLEESRAECRSLKQKLATILSIAQINGTETSSVNRDTDQDDYTDFPPESANIEDKSPTVDWEIVKGLEGRLERSEYTRQREADFDFTNSESPALDYFDGIYDEASLNVTAPPKLDAMDDLHFDTPSAASIELSFPESGLTCDCVHQNQPGTPNLWSTMSETLMGWKAHSCPENQLIGGENHDDIAVRAVTQGWNDLSLGKLSASWRILQGVDQKVWAKSRPVDRLAVLSIMNMLLQCHLNPTEENLSKLPPWYRPRPSQVAQKHAYAIDFFVWPGLRERFIYHQHKYCSNHFWSLLAQHFRFAWPYDLRDCYVHNRMTDRYELSTLFRRQLDDLSSFTLCKDMFDQFPEFESDISGYMAIPRALGLNPDSKKHGDGLRRVAIDKNLRDRRSLAYSAMPVTGLQSQWSCVPQEDIAASIFQDLGPAPFPMNQFF
ncbi:hypothetical protein LTR84_002995 [Exophiala bonariae]|uniref:BZIP domain-containing protein n=1 Tax=Exophiala bonariae TaxID=1690606 RepID=A0AAV9N8F2_9EURO|nr:hypothetical protein LTR84_002995 [Exophiala bonariae]